jgi:predicted SAM-dependent methyltransferase
LFAWDDVMDRPNYVDVLFDAAEDRWPFDDQEAEAVLLGDILEHLTHLDQVCVLNEARRVSKKLIITVPDDDRPETFQDRSHLPKGAVHVIHVTDQHLRSLLEDTGWTPEIFDVIDYGFVPAGYCVVAR